MKKYYSNELGNKADIIDTFIIFFYNKYSINKDYANTIVQI